MRNESSTKSRILLIEDNPADVYLIRLALEESGLEFEMTHFQSGADALEVLFPEAVAKVNPLVPDLILLDLNTPRCDGFEVLARIRGDAGLSHVPVAIVTSSSSVADKQRATLIGATRYIQKPTQLAALIDGVGTAVKELLANSKAASHSS